MGRIKQGLLYKSSIWTGVVNQDWIATWILEKLIYPSVKQRLKLNG